MTISGSITKVSSTQTSITVSWNITSNSGGFAELYVSGAGQSLFEGYGVSSPVTGSATVSGLSPNTSYTFNFGGIDNFNDTGGSSYSFSTDSVTPPPTYPPSWTDSTLGGFQVGVAYSDGVSATNSPTYSVSAGSLPAGISLNTSSGAVTGTPTTAGAYSFTLRAANGDGAVTQAFSGTVLAAPTAGKWQVWTGTTWVHGPLKVWNGSAWVASSVKVWNGSAWVTSV